jgi:hypothetical protein
VATLQAFLRVCEIMAIMNLDQGERFKSLEIGLLAKALIVIGSTNSGCEVPDLNQLLVIRGQPQAELLKIEPVVFSPTFVLQAKVEIETIDIKGSSFQAHPASKKERLPKEARTWGISPGGVTTTLLLASQPESQAKNQAFGLPSSGSQRGVF